MHTLPPLPLRLDLLQPPSVVSTAQFQQTLGPSIDFNHAWKKQWKNLQANQKMKCRQKLKRETGADEVDQITVTTSLTSLQYRLVYMPVYYYGYTYKYVLSPFMHFLFVPP